MEDWPYLANVTYPQIVVFGNKGAVIALPNKEQVRETGQHRQISYPHQVLKRYDLSTVKDGQYDVISETKKGVMRISVEVQGHEITRVSAPKRVNGG